MQNERDQRTLLDGWVTSTKERADALLAAAPAAAQAARHLQEETATLSILAAEAERAARMFDEAARACRDAEAAEAARAASSPPC